MYSLLNTLAFINTQGNLLGTTYVQDYTLIPGVALLNEVPTLVVQTSDNEEPVTEGMVRLFESALGPVEVASTTTVLTSRGFVRADHLTTDDTITVALNSVNYDLKTGLATYGLVNSAGLTVTSRSVKVGFGTSLIDVPLTVLDTLKVDSQYLATCTCCFPNSRYSTRVPVTLT